MSFMASFCAVLLPRDVLDEILEFIESVSAGFATLLFYKLGKRLVVLGLTAL